jgi:hypothetical protein
MMPAKVSLPEIEPRELQVILAGLDELPGKHSRVLYDKIVGHVNEQVNRANAPEIPAAPQPPPNTAPVVSSQGIVAELDREQSLSAIAAAAARTNGSVPPPELLGISDPTALSGTN